MFVTAMYGDSGSLVGLQQAVLQLLTTIGTQLPLGQFNRGHARARACAALQ